MNTAKNLNLEIYQAKKRNIYQKIKYAIKYGGFLAF